MEINLSLTVPDGTTPEGAAGALILAAVELSRITMGRPLVVDGNQLKYADTFYSLDGTPTKWAAVLYRSA